MRETALVLVGIDLDEREERLLNGACNLVAEAYDRARPVTPTPGVVKLNVSYSAALEPGLAELPREHPSGRDGDSIAEALWSWDPTGLPPREPVAARREYLLELLHSGTTAYVESRGWHRQRSEDGWLVRGGGCQRRSGWWSWSWCRGGVVASFSG